MKRELTDEAYRYIGHTQPINPRCNGSPVENVDQCALPLLSRKLLKDLRSMRRQCAPSELKDREVSRAMYSNASKRLLCYSLHRPLAEYFHRRRSTEQAMTTVVSTNDERVMIHGATHELRRIFSSLNSLPSVRDDLRICHIRAAHRVIKPSLRGAIRKKPMVIHNRHLQNESLYTVKPHHIPRYLNNACHFVKCDTHDWWLSVNLLYAQLLQIHAFDDANGRLSKVLACWYAKHVGGCQIYMSLLFLLHILIGREIFIPSRDRLRYGDPQAFLEYVEYSQDWVTSSLLQLELMLLQEKDDCAMRVVDSFVINLLENDYDGKIPVL